MICTCYGLLLIYLGTKLARSVAKILILFCKVMGEGTRGVR